MPQILELRDLKTYFYTDAGVVKSVDGVSFSVEAGQTVCVVGESGCGKSVTAASIMQLVPSPPGKIVGGEIFYNGRNLLALPKFQLRQLIGNEISMIFQEPMTSLNPVFSVGDQIMESLLLHRDFTRKQAKVRTIELISLVGISRPEAIFKAYPHQLSGGMRQRVMIAMALSCDPKLLIADEPTTALDVTIQAQILDLMRGIQQKLGTSILLITHDLGVVAEMADQVVVMYAGKVVERGSVRQIFNHPTHPYTVGLLKSKPKSGVKTDRLYSIPGQVPNPLGLTESCYFHTRCPLDQVERCKTFFPPLLPVEDGHLAACWLRAPERKGGNADG